MFLYSICSHLLFPIKFIICQNYMSVRYDVTIKYLRHYNIIIIVSLSQNFYFVHY